MNNEQHGKILKSSKIYHESIEWVWDFSMHNNNKSL